VWKQRFLGGTGDRMFRLVGGDSMGCGWGGADLYCCIVFGTVDGSEPGPFSFQHLSGGDAGSC